MLARILRTNRSRRAAFAASGQSDGPRSRRPSASRRWRRRRRAAIRRPRPRQRPAGVPRRRSDQRAPRIADRAAAGSASAATASRGSCGVAVIARARDVDRRVRRALDRQRPAHQRVAAREVARRRAPPSGDTRARIRLNMLMGRAGPGARADAAPQPDAGRGRDHRCVRTNRQLAYTDPSTRRARAEVAHDAGRHRTGSSATIPEMESRARGPAARRVSRESTQREAQPADRAGREGAMEPRACSPASRSTIRELGAASPYLVVLWPIENRSRVQGLSLATRAGTPTRTIRFAPCWSVRRSQAEVARTVTENERSTMRVGALTAGRVHRAHHILRAGARLPTAAEIPSAPCLHDA